MALKYPLEALGVLRAARAELQGRELGLAEGRVRRAKDALAALQGALQVARERERELARVTRLELEAGRARALDLAQSAAEVRAAAQVVEELARRERAARQAHEDALRRRAEVSASFATAEADRRAAEQHRERWASDCERERAEAVEEEAVDRWNAQHSESGRR